MGTGSHSSKRKKKRSQKHSKKRSKSIREKKSKKLKLRHDSVSCSDDDNLASTSSISRSDSSSEENYRGRRRARSRDRKDSRKGSKKKKIKRNRDSSMSDSSEDSHSRHLKKRKKSKKKQDIDSKKKRRVKKHRREPSSSSSIGQSPSLSRFEHSNDSSAEFEGKEEKREFKERDREDKCGEMIKSKRSRYSSRSCSPFSLQDDGRSYGSEERLMEENPPKRLKSVIVVLREIEEAEARDLNREEPKDEIVYEQDDYPTRSNDSNEGIGRGEGLLSSHDACDERSLLLEETNREAGSSDVGISEFSTVQRQDVDRTHKIGSNPNELGVGQSVVENPRVSNAGGSSNSVDLEVMLRQKALQNLLKRQGKLPKNNDGVTQGDKSEAKHPNGGGFVSAQKVGRIDDAKNTSSVPELPKDSLVHPPPIRKTETLAEKGSASTNPVISRPKVGLLTSTRRLLGSSNTWRRDPTSQNSPQSNPPTPKDTVDKGSNKVNEGSDKAIELRSPDAKVVTEKADGASASELPSYGGKNPKDKSNEADEDSEFEQKTMTVNRGGELVQVSYKVKIPKKAPALARRLLKRSP